MKIKAASRPSTGDPTSDSITQEKGIEYVRVQEKIMESRKIAEQAYQNGRMTAMQEATPRVKADTAAEELLLLALRAAGFTFVTGRIVR